MIVACLLSKEHPTLPLAEVKAVLRSKGIEFKVKKLVNNLALLEIDVSDIDYSFLSRLAMTREIGQIMGSFSYQQYGQGLSITSLPDKLPEKATFAVRSKSIDRTAPQNLESKLGALIKDKTGSKVDLEHPDIAFRIYCLQDELLLANLQVKVNRSQYESRKNQNRPFSHPTSLHPRWARTMVNLAEVGPNDSLLDPFVGTGGILLEAGLISCRLYGADVSEGMIQGAKTNLQAAGLKQFHLRQGDVNQLDSIFPETEFQAIVTDVPYGRASKKVGQALDNFLDQLDNFEQSKTVVMSDKPEIRGLKPDFSLYVHKNLTKYLYLLD